MKESNMSKILSLDIGSNSCKLILTEKAYNSVDILFYAEKNYAEPIREKITSDTSEIVENQIKNLIRDFRNVDNDIYQCNVAFGGSSVTSTIIESSIDNLDSSQIITQDQLNLLSKNNPKINSFITKETAHIIPLEYSLDGMIGIRHPLGMHTKKLSVKNLYVNVEKEDISLVSNILSNSGLSTNLIISEILAASQNLLNSDEKEIGSLIIDIGAASTDYCYLKKGKPLLTGSLPVGGNQFTSDLSIAFSTNKDFANQLKFETSCTPENERIAEKVIIKQEDSTRTFEITKRQISQVLKERAIEIFNLIRQEMIESLGQENLPERIILCGGGSKLDGMVPLARYIFQSKTRLVDTKNIKFLGENIPIEAMNVLSIANYAHKLDNDTEYSLSNKVESSKISSNVKGIDTEKIMKISSYIQNSVKIVIEKIKTIFKGK
ncbi:MAG: cell division protein FtsA [Dehalococcoidia bacterium]|nr:cell division protein FtsA [Dehalococcoidia bacterium]